MTNQPRITLKNLSENVQLKCCNIAFPTNSTMLDFCGDINKMNIWWDFCAESAELYGVLPLDAKAVTTIVSAEFSLKWG